MQKYLHGVRNPLPENSSDLTIEIFSMTVFDLKKIL